MITTIVAISLQLSIAAVPIERAATEIHETISEQEAVCMELGNSKEMCKITVRDVDITKGE